MIIISRQGETRLVETLSDITDQREQWQVLVYNFSQLLEEYKSDYQLRIAMNLAHDLLHTLDGGIYMCNSGDMAILVKQLNPQLEKKITFQLRYLYMDDPLAYDSNGDENNDFYNHYYLVRDFDACFTRFSKQMVRSERSGKQKAAVPASAKVLELFTASRMASVEKTLVKLDLSNSLRKQAVCAMTHTVQLRRVFEETYIHIPHMRELLDVEVDVLSNPWLFKYLTQLLDVRMLAMLRDKKQTLLASPVSININASTLLTDAFIEFDRALDSMQKVAVVFEIPVVDAFADTAGFVAACQHVQERGYRVCLDGLTHKSFLQIAPQAFGVDLVKLQWNATSSDDISADEQARLKNAISAVGTKRMILCRCDNEDAIDYGRSLGISLFQGRWLDRQMEPNQAQVN